MQIQSATQTDINAVLQQMRALRTQATVGAPVGEPIKTDLADGAAASGLVEGKRVNFGETLKGAVDAVNKLQQTAGSSANDFVLGKHSDLVKVMVDSQKANIGFQAMVQVRNRMVSAYQDIMNMPI